MPRCDLSRSEVTIQLLLHAWSHRQQWPMRQGRQLHAYGIAGPNVAFGDHDAHDSSLANQIAGRILVQRSGHQAFLEIVDLQGGIAQGGGCLTVSPIWASPATPNPLSRRMPRLGVLLKW